MSVLKHLARKINIPLNNYLFFIIALCFFGKEAFNSVTKSVNCVIYNVLHEYFATLFLESAVKKISMKLSRIREGFTKCEKKKFFAARSWNEII